MTHNDFDLSEVLELPFRGLSAATNKGPLDGVPATSKGPLGR